MRLVPCFNLLSSTYILFFLLPNVLPCLSGNLVQSSTVYLQQGHKQWDQIGPLFKVKGDHFLTNEVQTFSYFWAILKIFTIYKKADAATFWETIGLLFFHHLVTLDNWLIRSFSPFQRPKLSLRSRWTNSKAKLKANAQSSNGPWAFKGHPLALESIQHNNNNNEIEPSHF